MIERVHVKGKEIDCVTQISFIGRSDAVAITSIALDENGSCLTDGFSLLENVNHYKASDVKFGSNL